MMVLLLPKSLSPSWKPLKKNTLRGRKKMLPSCWNCLGWMGFTLLTSYRTCIGKRARSYGRSWQRTMARRLSLMTTIRPAILPPIIQCKKGIWMLTVRDTSQGRACPLTQSTGTLPLRRRSLWK